MLLRILSILFPLFAITAVGFVVGRRLKPDLSHANRLNMDVCTPALVFGALASKEFHLDQYLPLLGAAFLVIAGSGLVGWAVARLAGIDPKTLVPLMLLALGVRMAESRITAIGFGVFGAALRPAAGMALAWVAARLIALPPREEALLLVFGALPPAVLNYMLAERYGQEPDKVASMVLIGNLATVVFMPLALAVALGVALPP